MTSKSPHVPSRKHTAPRSKAKPAPTPFQYFPSHESTKMNNTAPNTTNAPATEASATAHRRFCEASNELLLSNPEQLAVHEAIEKMGEAEDQVDKIAGLLARL